MPNSRQTRGSQSTQERSRERTPIPRKQQSSSSSSTLGRSQVSVAFACRCCTAPVLSDSPSQMCTYEYVDEEGWQQCRHRYGPCCTKASEPRVCPCCRKARDDYVWMLRLTDRVPAFTITGQRVWSCTPVEDTEA